jgi:hypothetical protein
MHTPQQELSAARAALAVSDEARVRLQRQVQDLQAHILKSALYNCVLHVECVLSPQPLHTVNFYRK